MDEEPPGGPGDSRDAEGGGPEPGGGPAPEASGPAGPGQLRLRRDRATWTLDSFFVSWAWFLSAFSPSVPLLAAEQGVTRAEAGLHGTAMALGPIVVGLTISRLVPRLGRCRLLAAGALLLALGAGGLVVGHALALTLPAVFVATLGGSCTMACAQPALALHHGPAAPAALSEANAIGSASGLLAPLAVGACVALGWGWQPAVGVTILLAAGTLAALVTLPEDQAPGTVPLAETPEEPAAGLGRIFALYWVVVLVAVAVENATTFWAGDLIRVHTGASASASTSAVAALVAGMLVARLATGRLALRVPAGRLLLPACALTVAGWLAMWLSPTSLPAVAGLALLGLGLGGLWPLGSALALRAAGPQTDRAQARISLGSGVAVAVGPFALGALADAWGTHAAFLLVPALVAVGAVAASAAAVRTGAAQGSRRRLPPEAGSRREVERR